jgi:hypothetical protein
MNFAYLSMGKEGKFDAYSKKTKLNIGLTRGFLRFAIEAQISLSASGPIENPIKITNAFAATDFAYVSAKLGRFNPKEEVVSKVCCVSGLDTDMFGVSTRYSVPDATHSIGGELKFQGTNLGLTSFGNLTNYGGDIDCVSIFTNVISLGNLEECGNLIIGENSALESTGNLKKAKSIICNSSKEVTFPNLEEIKSEAIFNKCQSTELPNLQRVGTNFSINSSRIKSFPNLTFIGGNADFGNNFTKIQRT